MYFSVMKVFKCEARKCKLYDIGDDIMLIQLMTWRYRITYT